MSAATAARRAILGGGLIAATLDLGYAFTAWGMKGVAPERILQSVASGWLGTAAFQGGAVAALLGAVSHYGILLVAASLYWLASDRLTALADKPEWFGPLYGLVIYGVMNYLVVPLSAAPPRPGMPPWDLLLGGLLIHAFGVGLPIALATRAGRARPHVG